MAQTKAKVIKSLVIALLITSINSTNTYAAGRTNGSIANTVLSGSGVPSTKVGIDGDFYIDTKSLNFYGPKINSKWPIPVSLKGPAGPIGPSGVDGKNGTAGSSSASIGAPGPAGATGPAGPQGATGATGAQGATGPQGPAGSGGGGAGPAGPKGETGTAGAVGPSNVQSLTISNWTLATNTPAGPSESNVFGSLEAGKKYFYTIIVKGIGATGLTKFRAGLELKSSDSSSVPDYEYSYAFAAAHTSGAYNSRLSFVISGTISVTNNAQFSIVITDGEGSGNSIALSGKAFIQLVGAIN
ncbi:unannotated protein [freshwater metagenome]|uniref:Unannotated protein n=1 Tax=freshwater metagenome TaxID=449393 RepID=A0A6J7LY45_9ZZZZ|nr:hypothetical protein [Actinomycetota bacterium]